MKYAIGRSNLAATIYVPYDCKNNCPFCTSKEQYSQLTMNEDAVKKVLKQVVHNTNIKDIVFTGGEPTANPKLLEELVNIASQSGKRIFINTTLPRENFFDCLPIFNSGMVDCLNVSRHFSTYEQDSKVFNDIVEDWVLKAIRIPIKINVVLNDNTSISEVNGCIDRWKDNHKVSVCFRRDFRKTTPETLHLLTGDRILEWLILNYEYGGHSFCDVCDTVSFNNHISFHRGLEHSSFQVGDTVVVNDIIIFPDGFISYDWDRKSVENLDGFVPHYNPIGEISANRRQSSGNVKIKSYVKMVDDYTNDSSCGVKFCGSSGQCGSCSQSC